MRSLETRPTRRRSTAALGRPSGLKGSSVSNARKGRPAIYGFVDLAGTRPLPVILRYRIRTLLSDSPSLFPVQGAGSHTPTLPRP
jgi:hypothetical protein